MKKSIFITLIAVIVLSCQAPSRSKESAASSENKTTTENGFQLTGKKALITYPDFTAEVAYLSDSTLHWKTTKKDGKVSEGTEDAFIHKLNNDQYFINWIEASGLTISQVIDLKAKIVTAYASYGDEQSPRGKRNNMVLKGTLELVK